ncbi:MAG: ATP-dependent DNA helicase UvrD2 [Ilumatobacteraceae bacterium]
MDITELLVGLDADQLAAVTEPSYPLAIVAAAGSGKTTVLTRRIAHRVLIDPDVHAQHVLALTFTSQAARELQRRLRKLGLRDRIEAGTFHAVALRLLRQRAADQGHPLPIVASDRVRLLSEATKMIAAAGTRSAPSRDEIVALLGDLDWCRSRQVSFADAPGAFRKAGRRSAFGVDRLGAAADAFALVKRRRGVVDFDDLLEHCLSAMRTDPLWAAGVRWRFRHLFVDETQDLNPLQHALLEAIRGDRVDLCLVGDPRQAIFGFNGSDPEIMNSVERLYPGITIVRLRRNYRCSPQIIAGGARVLHNAGLVDDSIAVAADGPAIRLQAFVDERSEAAAIGAILREHVGVQRPWMSCAVLARTVAQLTEVAHALATLGIPTRMQGRSGKSSALGSALSEAFAQRNPADLATWIERITGDAEADPIRARVAEAADRFIAQGTGLTFRAWVELHSPFDDLETEQADDAVDLLTFHGAKGREWPMVVVAGVDAGMVPHYTATTAGQRDEEARLLYVACTRAKEELVISWVERRNGRATQPSPLISDIGESADDVIVAPPLRRLPRPAPDPVYVALVEWRRSAAKAAQVDPTTICSDESLRAIAQARPTTVDGVAALTDLGPIAAARVAPRLLAALNRAV